MKISKPTSRLPAAALWRTSGPRAVPQAPASDRELLTQIERGSKQAFEILYDRMAPQALGVACAIVRETRLAEAVTTEAFWLVWQHAEEFLKTNTSFSSCFLEKVRALAIGERRRREGAKDAVPAADLNEDYKAGARPTAHPFKPGAPIAAMPAEQRAVIELAYFGGMSCAEISVVCGEPTHQIHRWAQLGLAGLGDGRVGQ